MFKHSLWTQILLLTLIAFVLASPAQAEIRSATVAVDGMSPGECKSGGAGLTIRFGLHQTPFGPCLLSQTDRGVCGLEFAEIESADIAHGLLAEEWPGAELRHDSNATGQTVQEIFVPPAGGRTTTPLTLHLRGTNFQLQVWRALLRVPKGCVITYGGLGERLRPATAPRAAARAVAANRVGFLVPCHRVIRSSGALGGYRWGAERKQAMLARERLARERLARERLAQESAASSEPQPEAAGSR